MSKLLNETTVARWHKLAKINEGVSKNFLQEMEGLPPAEEDELGGELGGGDELPMDDEAPMDDELPMDDEAPIDDLGGGDVSMSEEDVTALVDDIAAAIATHTGVEVDVTSDSLGADDLEGDLGDDLGGEEIAPEDEESLDMGDEMGYDDSGDEELEGLAEALKDANIKVLDDNKIVNEITKRVTKRILAAIQSN
jgi:hypothetical protein|tara:strand:+ start:9428 stop:10012 length:585 start_codon:yes stop_codon:yes gene_type:complete